MYTSFTVRNYRCFDDLRLTGLNRINLISGRNNVGKTALLEALFLHAGGNNPTLTLKVEAWRGLDTFKFELGRWSEMPWAMLFTDMDASRTIELSGQFSSGEDRTVLIRVPTQVAGELEGQTVAAVMRESSPGYDRPGELELVEQRGTDKKTYLLRVGSTVQVQPVARTPRLPAVFLAARWRPPLSEDADRFSHQLAERREDVLLSALKLLEPRLKSLALLTIAGSPVIHGDIGLARLVPLPDMGEGMVRLASLILAMGHASGGVLLVDEVENGLHHSVLQKVWGAVAAAARAADVQVFATTHSWENIVAAHEALGGGRRPVLSYYRLERLEGKIQAVAYKPRMLEASFESGLEVR